LHFNQYDQLIQAALEGHGVALGRVALLQPMLRDGRLVAPPNLTPGVSEYAYWLCAPADAPRPAVASFRDWIIGQARGDTPARNRAARRMG
jgi:DNA-binding transcriptional LysR family regulator